MGSIPGQGAEAPQALQLKNQTIKQKQYCNKFNRLFKWSTLKKIKIKKNSRYYSHPHYTDVEIEHREVKGLSQSLRLSRCWKQDSNPDSAALGFHHHLSRPHHLLPTLQTSAVF